ncbi:DUF1236 domain-containing protein [Sinorhizobium medicae]|nr:DUF1236 domain-containing protein [Sinorhizobium medicae]MDX0826581.1 DUF1236 domain-containing protein [Sinorhizobium medicae]
MDHLQTSGSHHRAKSKSEIQATVRRLAPFHHAIDLPFGLSTFVPELSRQTRERTRLQTFLDHAWGSILTACGGSLKGKRVLQQPAPPSVVVQQPVAVGKPIPETVVLTPVPENPTYAYAVVNERRVIVEPKSRTVVQVVN